MPDLRHHPRYPRHSHEDALRPPFSIFRSSGRHRDVDLVALLPVFNGERHLEKCLRSLSKAVDSVIAIDDGSTDRTPEILRDYGIVETLVTYPVKPIEHWNEAWTRRALYDLAAEVNPRWVFCFDADEEIEPTFATFRYSLLTQPQEIKGYVFPRVGIYREKITRPIYLHRMYRYAPGYSFHTKRIHCRAIPLNIYLEEMRIVNVRLFHHSVSPTDRHARYEKYLKVDPTYKYQASYDNLLTLRAKHEILPLGNTLTLKPVEEDGFQRPLVGRRFFQPGEPTALYHEEHLIRRVTIRLRTTFDLFNRLRLKTFTIANREGSLFRARYAYDEEVHIVLNEYEAWFIESYWIRKELIDMLAHFKCVFGIGFPKSLNIFQSIVKSLLSKEILCVID